MALFAGQSRLAHDALKQPEVNAPAAAPKDNNDSSSEEEDEEQSQKATLKLDEWLSLKAEPAVRMPGAILEAGLSPAKFDCQQS